jgi:hypothetical protein
MLNPVRRDDQGAKEEDEEGDEIQKGNAIPLLGPYFKK